MLIPEAKPTRCRERCGGASGSGGRSQRVRPRGVESSGATSSPICTAKSQYPTPPPHAADRGNRGKSGAARRLGLRRRRRRRTRSIVGRSGSPAAGVQSGRRDGIEAQLRGHAGRHRTCIGKACSLLPAPHYRIPTYRISATGYLLPAICCRLSAAGTLLRYSNPIRSMRACISGLWPRKRT